MNRTRMVIFFFACLLAAGNVRADVLEFVTGAKLEGQIVDRDEKSITFTSTLGGNDHTRKYPIDRIRAVVEGGQREVLQEAPAAGAPSRSGRKAPAASGGSRTSGTTAGVPQRSRAEVEKLIGQLGRTRPDWWDSVPLDYPKTLDLSWPDQPPPPWNNQKNVGQYVWDIINHNASKWREGARFMHYLLTLHKDHPRQRSKAMRELARMYQNLLQDYARAAFWWRQVGVEQGDDYAGVHLAECYWKLGSKPMALEQLRKTPPSFAMIKLWADMGETKMALQMADAELHGEYGDVAGIYAGDACRVAGQHAKALQYYQQVLKVSADGQAKKRIERNQQRARANIEAIELFDTLDLRRVPDGTYRDASLGYEAQVEVEVTVKAGRIESVRVTKHREKQFYAAMIETPAKIIAKQGVQAIDATSSATITSEAVINATAKALAKGMK